jgi:hypothetical protein
MLDETLPDEDLKKSYFIFLPRISGNELQID